MISEPERFAASTMTTPSDSPEISRLRRWKSRPRGSHPHRLFREGATGGKNVGEQLQMLGRIDAVLPAGEHGDRSG